MAQRKRFSRGKDSTSHRYTWINQPQSLYQLTRYLDSVVYFIRCPDGCIKIGYTRDLANRAYALAVGWSDILAIVPGGRELEQEMHAHFRPFRARSREYYDPAPELLAHINGLRLNMGISPVTPWQRTRLAPLAPLDKGAETAS